VYNITQLAAKAKLIINIIIMKGISLKIVTVSAFSFALLVTTSVVSAQTPAQDREARKDIRQGSIQERKDIRTENRRCCRNRRDTTNIKR
jgi:hypothetical protein